MAKLANKNNFIIHRNRHYIDPIRGTNKKEIMFISRSRANRSRLIDSKHPAVNELPASLSYPATYFTHLITLEVRRTSFKKRRDTFLVIFRLKTLCQCRGVVNHVLTNIRAQPFVNQCLNTLVGKG